MMKKVLVSAAVCLILSLCIVPSAWAGPRTLVGSWSATAVADSTGETTSSLWTASRGGTVVVSGDSVNFSAAHGSFEKVGPRTFEVTNVAFGYGPDGNAAFTLVNTSTIEISRDGDSFTAVFSAEVKALDGTVIGSETGTASATRITAH